MGGDHPYIYPILFGGFVLRREVLRLWFCVEGLLETFCLRRCLVTGGLFSRRGVLSRGISKCTHIATAAAVTRTWQSVGPSRFKFLVAAAVATRNFHQLGPGQAEFIVTKAGVTRNMNRVGPSPFTLLITAAAVTRNWQSVGPS